MDPKSYTSFIPKNTMSPSAVRTHSSINLAFTISFLILLLSFGAAGGLYVYKKILNTQILSINQELIAARNNLHKENIDTWKRLDDRINLSERLMQSHIASSQLFKILEDQTMRRIQLTSVKFDATDMGMKIDIKGLADSYGTLALQADVFGTEAVSKYFKDAVISEVTPDDKGRISYDLSATVNPDLVSYKELMDSYSQSVTSQTSSTGTTGGAATSSTSATSDIITPSTKIIKP